MEVVKDKARYCTLHTVHYTTLHTAPNLPQVPLLVATDLAAKGLDTPGVDFHYNFHLITEDVYRSGPWQTGFLHLLNPIRSQGILGILCWVVHMVLSMLPKVSEFWI